MTGVTYASARGRWVVLATVLGSGLATIDATVVGIALPAIGREFNTGLTSLQWIVTGYTLTLAGLLLVAGALGDRYGRRRVFVVGVVWFALASLLCGLAPNAGVLIAARTLQGVGAALLTPSSLAILEATFVPEDRGRAIGAWSGLGGLAAAVGPFLGGWLISAFSWRLIFYINLPLAAAVILVSLRHVPETRSATATGRIDLLGGALVTGSLLGLCYGLTEGGPLGWDSPAVLFALIAGVALLVFGSGPVRGFAIVHCLGIMTSMFSAVVFSRGLVNLWYGRQKKLKSVSIGQVWKPAAASDAKADA
jgi:EmrB/QacA subfamily drug resistance transporter